MVYPKSQISDSTLVNAVELERSAKASRLERLVPPEAPPEEEPPTPPAEELPAEEDPPAPPNKKGPDEEEDAEGFMKEKT